MSPSVMWLVAGALFICIEIFGMPGIGFLFAGIGALITGVAIQTGLVEPTATVMHFTLFFITACISAALLWKRLKHHIPRAPKYHNMVGTEGVVGNGGLAGTKIGEVRWSGTQMRARLVDHAPVDVLAEGAPVIIRHVEGNVLFVAPKH